jgi:FAD/FMN-containing dehydrogenase
MTRGRPPARYDLALSLARLGRLLDHDAENLTLTGEGGLIVSEANRRIAASHQMLALGLPDASHTLGGLVAANPVTPKHLLYGNVRDQLLGLRVALPDGRLVRYGRKVLKNVAGYDMNKLFLGSQGLLGVVVEATFKLFARPDQEGMLLASFPELEAALSAAGRLYRSQLLPALVRLADPAAAGDSSGIPRAAGGARLLAAFEGRPITLQRQLSDARALLEQGGATDVRPVAAGTPGVAALLEPPSASLRLRVGVLPTRLGELLRALPGLVGDLPLETAWVADYGAGQLHLSLAAADPAALEARGAAEPASGLGGLAARIAALRAALEAQRGFVVLEAAPVSLKERVPALGVSAGERTLMRLLKSRFDPRDTMAPGRFLDGP